LVFEQEQGQPSYFEYIAAGKTAGEDIRSWDYYRPPVSENDSTKS